MEEEYFTIKEAIIRTGKSEATIRRLVRMLRAQYGVELGDTNDQIIPKTSLLRKRNESADIVECDRKPLSVKRSHDVPENMIIVQEEPPARTAFVFEFPFVSSYMRSFGNMRQIMLINLKEAERDLEETRHGIHMSQAEGIEARAALWHALGRQQTQAQE